MSNKIENKQLADSIKTISEYCTSQRICKDSCIFNILTTKDYCCLINPLSVERWKTDEIKIDNFEDSMVLDSSQYLKYFCSKRQNCIDCPFADSDRRCIICNDSIPPEDWLEHIEIKEE